MDTTKLCFEKYSYNENMVNFQILLMDLIRFFQIELNRFSRRTMKNFTRVREILKVQIFLAQKLLLKFINTQSQEY